MAREILKFTFAKIKQWSRLVRGVKTPILDVTSGLVVKNQSKIFSWRVGSFIKCGRSKEDTTRDKDDCR